MLIVRQEEAIARERGSPHFIDATRRRAMRASLGFRDLVAFWMQLQQVFSDEAFAIDGVSILSPRYTEVVVVAKLDRSDLPPRTLANQDRSDIIFLAQNVMVEGFRCR